MLGHSVARQVLALFYPAPAVATAIRTKLGPWEVRGVVHMGTTQAVGKAKMAGVVCMQVALPQLGALAGGPLVALVGQGMALSTMELHRPLEVWDRAAVAAEHRLGQAVSALTVVLAWWLFGTRSSHENLRTNKQWACRRVN